ncbi:2718_t:CDS:2, partial [Dentiscutata erythropus]
DDDESNVMAKLKAENIPYHTMYLFIVKNQQCTSLAKTGNPDESAKLEDQVTSKRFQSSCCEWIAGIINCAWECTT